MRTPAPLCCLLFGAALVACTQQEPSIGGSHTPDHSKTGEMVYLKAADIQATWPHRAPAGLWNPTSQEGDDAYAALRLYLSKPEAGLDGWPEQARQQVARHIATYNIRISGITATGSSGTPPQLRLVNLEGVCQEIAKATVWKKPDFAVLDGGACIFDATYDPKSKKIVGFWPHGLA